MSALLQVIAIVAFLAVLILLPDVAWHLLRLRRLRSGIDIGTMPWSPAYWYGLRMKGAVVGLSFALVAGVVALGASDLRLGGYVLLLVGAMFVLGGLAMLLDWQRIGSRWAASVISWQERIRRHQLDRSGAQLRQLRRFGGVLFAVIGLGWGAAGIGLAAGWLK